MRIKDLTEKERQEAIRILEEAQKQLTEREIRRIAAQKAIKNAGVNWVIEELLRK